MDCRYIASLVDGRVVPYFPDGAIPGNFVQISDALLKKWNNGEFANGIDLAKAALLGNAAVGTERVEKPVEKLADDTTGDAKSKNKSSKEHL